MSKRIAIGGILTECNHFGGLPIDMAVYEASELLFGEEMLEATTSVVGGMLRTLRDHDAEPLPLLYASACSGRPITSDTYRQLRSDLIDRLRQASPVDGVLLPIHGAALAEDCDDPEGDMIVAVREIVGPDVPVIATLDLHAHITADMVRHADALLGWETYPHHDQFPTGQRAARLLMRTLAGECRPTMAMSKVPVITSAINGSTNGDDPFADLMRMTKSMETQPGVLTTSLFLIHPYMDVANMGSGGLVVTDNNLDQSIELSRQIAQAYWERRHDLEPETLSPAEAIARGEKLDGGPVILVDAADCCGGGAAGDGVAVLSALLASRPSQPAYVPLVDPQAAAACHQAGEGAELTLRVGHQLDPIWGTPIEVTGVVSQLTDGRFTYTGGQWEGHRENMGPTAVLRIGEIRLLLMSRATYDWADEQWRSVDLDPQRAKFIVAKNPMNYRHAYGSIAKACIVLDSPGPTPATLKHIDFQKMQRPYFPADSEIPGLKPTTLT